MSARHTPWRNWRNSYALTMQRRTPFGKLVRAMHRAHATIAKANSSESTQEKKS